MGTQQGRCFRSATVWSPIVCWCRHRHDAWRWWFLWRRRWWFLRRWRWRFLRRWRWRFVRGWRWRFLRRWRWRFVRRWRWRYVRRWRWWYVRRWRWRLRRLTCAWKEMVVVSSDRICRRWTHYAASFAFSFLEFVGFHRPRAAISLAAFLCKPLCPLTRACFLRTVCRACSFFSVCRVRVSVPVEYVHWSRTLECSSQEFA